MSCPNIDSLHAEEHQAHVQSCQACRSLAAMHSLERPDPESCEVVDGLMGLLGEMTTEDSHRLHDHLADCPACMVTYLTLVDDEAAPTTQLPPWKGPSMEIAHQSPKFSPRNALVGGLSFVVVALLVVLLVRQSDEDREMAVISPEQSIEKTPLATPPLKTPSSEAVPSATTAPGASRPGPASQATSAQSPSPAKGLPAGRGAELAAMTEGALREERMDDATKYCSEATKLDPLDDATSYVCALANCTSSRDGSTFDLLALRIKSSALRAGAVQICEERRKGWGYVDQCDEVTCLVDPSKACCQLKKAPATRPALTVDEMVERAKDEVKDRRYAKGLELCEAALELEPDSVQARTVCGVAACNLKMRKRAKGHIGKIVGESRKAALRQICIREGVKL